MPANGRWDLIRSLKVNQHACLDMPKNCIMAELEILYTEGKASFQLDEPPTHYALAVREYTSEVSRDRWIGHWSPVLPAPLDWPPRSPDQ